jgi:hypothetical protein
VTDIIKPSDKEWTKVAPEGPKDGHENALLDEIDRVFLAIHTF